MGRDRELRKKGERGRVSELAVDVLFQISGWPD